MIVKFVAELIFLTIRKTPVSFDIFYDSTTCLT